MNVNYKRCDCGNVHLCRETCTACIGSRRAQAVAKAEQQNAVFMGVDYGADGGLSFAFAQVPGIRVKRFPYPQAARERVEALKSRIRAAQDGAIKGPSVDGIFDEVMRLSQEPAAVAEAKAFVEHAKAEIAQATDAMARGAHHSRGVVESVDLVTGTIRLTKPEDACHFHPGMHLADARVAPAVDPYEYWNPAKAPGERLEGMGPQTRKEVLDAWVNRGFVSQSLADELNGTPVTTIEDDDGLIIRKTRPNTPEENAVLTEACKRIAERGPVLLPVKPVTSAVAMRAHDERLRGAKIDAVFIDEASVEQEKQQLEIQRDFEERQRHALAARTWPDTARLRYEADRFDQLVTAQLDAHDAWEAGGKKGAEPYRWLSANPWRLSP